MTLDNVSKSNYNRDDIRYIVIHHTATDNNATAEDVLASMQKRYGEPVPTHYIVDSYWTVINTVPITEPAWGFSTKNWWLTLDDAIQLNRQSIHIEVVWTRTDTEHQAKLSSSQEKALRELVSNLQSQYPQATLTAHSLVDKNKWSCWQAVLKTLTEEKEHDWINISLSRYYSVQPNQTSYYWGRTYEEDFAINCQWDCLTTADWHQLKSSEAWLVVACPKEYALWTKFYVEWLWTVTCHDRWGAIVSQGETIRLDVRSWIGDTWRINIQTNKIRTWKTRWYVID